MKLSSFDRVRNLVDARHCLEAQRRGALEKTIRLEISMEGFQVYGSPQGRMNYDEATMSGAVRDAVVSELDRRIEANGAALQAAGVQIEA